MNEIIFELLSFEIEGTDNPLRPMFINLLGTFSIDSEIIRAPWHIGIAEITRRFPNVEFRTVWNKNVCRLIPVENAPRFIEDPECRFFFIEE